MMDQLCPKMTLVTEKTILVKKFINNDNNNNNKTSTVFITVSI